MNDRTKGKGEAADDSGGTGPEVTFGAARGASITMRNSDGVAEDAELSELEQGANSNSALVKRKTAGGQDGGADEVEAGETDSEESADDAGTEGDLGDAADEEAGGEHDDAPDGAAEDLGDYDPASEEVIAKFDTAYRTKDGQPNLDKIGAEWWANAEKNEGAGGLNESTYKYLEHTYGLSRDQIKQLEAGEVARQGQALQGIYQRAGGKQNLDAALEWGRKGGYTKPQRERFTKIMATGDAESQAEAVDALMQRYGGATGRTIRPGNRVRQPLSPRRDATNPTGTRPAPRSAKEQGFKNRAEYDAASREANASRDPAAIAEVRRKLRVSSFWKQQQK